MSKDYVATLPPKSEFNNNGKKNYIFLLEYLLKSKVISKGKVDLDKLDREDLLSRWEMSDTDNGNDTIPIETRKKNSIDSSMESVAVILRFIAAPELTVKQLREHFGLKVLEGMPATAKIKNHDKDTRNHRVEIVQSLGVSQKKTRRPIIKFLDSIEAKTFADCPENIFSVSSAGGINVDGIDDLF